MTSIPHWAQKPKHKKKVVATNRGWEVESTGEVLKRVNNLPERLESLFNEVDEVRASVQPEQDVTVTLDQITQTHSGTGDNVAGDKTEVVTTESETEQEQTQTETETTTDAETGTETETEAKEEQKPARKKPGPKPKSQRKKPGPKPKSQKQGEKGQ